jgi:hypothetical protein
MFWKKLLLFCNLLIANSQKSKWVLKLCPCNSLHNKRQYGQNFWPYRIWLTLERLIAEPHAIWLILTCGLFAVVARTATSCVMDLLQQWFSVLQLPVARTPNKCYPLYVLMECFIQDTLQCTVASHFFSFFINEKHVQLFFISVHTDKPLL